MKSLSKFGLFSVLLCCGASHAQSSKPTTAPTPTPKPYVWAPWLSQDDNIWLRDNARVSGALVSVQLGRQMEESEFIFVPPAVILLSKRYRQASKLSVFYYQSAFGHTIDFVVNTKPLSVEQIKSKDVSQLRYEQLPRPSDEELF